MNGFKTSNNSNHYFGFFHTKKTIARTMKTIPSMNRNMFMANPFMIRGDRTDSNPNNKKIRAKIAENCEEF
jgi:hypothetical protein